MIIEKHCEGKKAQQPEEQSQDAVKSLVHVWDFCKQVEKSRHLD